MEVRDIKKLYYSISEVSEITSLKQYVLRYWETEFSQLKPGKIGPETEFIALMTLTLL